MIILLLFIPIIGIIISLQITDNKKIKKIGLITAMINFIISIIMWNKFNYSCIQPQFLIRFTSIITVGVDGISLLFILLTTFIIVISILDSWNIKHNIKYFINSLLLLETILIGVFVILDILIFYIFFEASLIPMFLLIGLFGSDKQGYKKGKEKEELTRIYATYQFFLMTLAGSLLMLLAILTLYSFSGTYDYIFISSSYLLPSRQFIIWLGFFISFAIKTPLLPFHQWLPLAHTEAPLSGSIILAGIMLKLATYGFIRYSLNLFPEGSYYFLPLILPLSLLGIIYSSLTTLRQIDFKKIIAYSSIGHMAIAIMSLFSFLYQGLSGAIFLSIAHGFTSPGLFICAATLYNRFHSRTLLYYRGLNILMPLLGIILMYLILANMATPLTNNFVGEFLSFIGIFGINPYIGFFSSLSIILVAAYSIWFYGRILFASYSLHLKSNIIDFTKKEFSFLLPILIGIFITAIYPNLLIDIIEYDISLILLTNSYSFTDTLYTIFIPISLLSKKHIFCRFFS